MVAIFRINTLTPALTAGPDVNQVCRPSRGMGNEVLGVGVQEPVVSVVVREGLGSHLVRDFNMIHISECR